MNAPTEVITTTCQEDGETVDSHELGLRQAEQRRQPERELAPWGEYVRQVTVV